MALVLVKEMVLLLEEGTGLVLDEVTATCRGRRRRATPRARGSPARRRSTRRTRAPPGSMGCNHRKQDRSDALYLLDGEIGQREGRQKHGRSQHAILGRTLDPADEIAPVGKVRRERKAEAARGHIQPDAADTPAVVDPVVSTGRLGKRRRVVPPPSNEVCRNFLKGRPCRHGIRCPYQHPTTSHSSSGPPSRGRTQTGSSSSNGGYGNPPPFAREGFGRRA